MKITRSEIEEAVNAAHTHDHGTSRKSWNRVDTLIRETRGKVELRAHLEARLIDLLQSGATAASKKIACQKLWTIGTVASVPVLAGMLLQEGTAEMACYALSGLPSREAGRALRAALGKARGPALVAVVNLLGERRDAESAGDVAKLVTSPDHAVADAALAALGKIASAGSRDALALLRKHGGDHRGAATHAYLQCAQELARRGDSSRARAIYEDLSAPAVPLHIRRGALLGRIELGDAKAVPGYFSIVPGLSIFDGKTLTGWEGNREMFRVDQGAIVGGSLKKRIPHNEFLCTLKEYGDFELRLEVKLIGEGNNAGIQIRSHRVPGSHEVSGYQADMGGGCWGCLYDESRRRRMLATVQQKKLSRVLRPGDWNEYLIRCAGKRIQLWINDFQTADYTEREEGIADRGIIGLQIHGGAPAEAWYREIRIKELP